MTHRLIDALLGIFAAACFAGCGSGDGPGVAWRVTDQRLVAPFEAAAREWCEQSDGRYCPHQDRDSSHAVYDSSDDPDSGPHRGWYDPADYSIGVALSVSTDPDRLRRTIAHELGHAGGIVGHLPPDTGVMSDPAWLHVTAADVQRLP